ncbi:Asp-tRNA(Asn)/Glu-tRNA(Gln) amidotransferase subunit GatC [Oceanobacillus sp. CAU 1775]
MENISKDLVLHVANLARLAITDDEAETLSKELQSIINYAEELNELDTSNVKPTTHVVDFINVMRKDEPKPWADREQLLKNAPEQSNGLVRVPTILSE